MVIHHIDVDRVVVEPVVDSTSKDNKLGGVT